MSGACLRTQTVFSTICLHENNFPMGKLWEKPRRVAGEKEKSGWGEMFMSEKSFDCENKMKILICLCNENRVAGEIKASADSAWSWKITIARFSFRAATHAVLPAPPPPPPRLQGRRGEHSKVMQCCECKLDIIRRRMGTRASSSLLNPASDREQTPTQVRVKF